VLMDDAAIERLRIAVRLLNLCHDKSEEVTDAEIETLKSYLASDVTNVAVEEIAAAVIRRELQLEPSDEDSSRTPRGWAQQSTAR
jgi:hypothetical protein